MELQEIEVLIDEDGNVKIEVRGVAGNACLELTAELEEALGGDIISREMTHEAGEGVQDSVNVKQRQRT